MSQGITLLLYSLCTVFIKKKKKFKPQQKEYFQLYLEIGELVSVEQARDFFKNT